MLLAGIQIYNLDIARINKQYKEMKLLYAVGKSDMELQINRVCFVAHPIDR